MEQNQVTINELSVNFIAEMRRIGYSEATIFQNIFRSVRHVVKYYEIAGVTFYSLETTAELLKLYTERRERDEISDAYLRQIRSITNRMNEFFITGSLRISANKHGTIYTISAENENLVDRFIVWKDYGCNTKDDVRWVVRKYLFYLEQLGHLTMTNVSIDEIRDFILQTAMDVKAASLHNILLYLKYFHMFLKDEGISAPDAVEIFSYKVYREMPIQSYVTDEELERIFSVINRETRLGKRDYAIIQVGATTGLRAADIIELKLMDINWRKGEIQIQQKKTKREVILPLVSETAEAIQDYILNGRPTSDYSELFLRHSAPAYAICTASAIGDMFKRYQRKAGLTRQTMDGKGFHGLRRRLAKKLLISGTPSTSISQILGHDDPSAVRQYLCLDTSNLKECALSFKGIELGRKELM